MSALDGAVAPDNCTESAGGAQGRRSVTGPQATVEGIRPNVEATCEAAGQARSELRGAEGPERHKHEAGTFLVFVKVNPVNPVNPV